jgi:hypothetical protein
LRLFFFKREAMLLLIAGGCSTPGLTFSADLKSSFVVMLKRLLNGNGKGRHFESLN